ncbi:MAG: hypothetical protein ABI571_06740, partial [Actinomycetota bacterium]
YELDRAVRIDLLGLESSTDDTGARIVILTTTARVFFELPEGGIAPVPNADGTITPETETTPGAVETPAATS